MEKYYKSITITILGIASWVSAKIGMLAPLLYGFTTLMIVDYLSGMIAAKVEAIEHPGDGNFGWSSKKGSVGILKKVGYICVIVAAMIFDYIIAAVTGYFNFDNPAKTFFGALVVLWYILNEIISIMENADRMHARVPIWAKRYIAAIQGEIEEHFEKEEQK